MGMTPPLHISKFTSCWNKSNSVVERKALWNAAYSDQGVSNKLADFLVQQVISSSQHLISDSIVTITLR